MADAAAKREARRRKILENSEYRLQRITSQANEQPVERNKKSIGTELPSNTLSSTPNGVLASEAIIGNQSVDSLIDDLNADIDVKESTRQSRYAAKHDIYNLISTPNVPHKRNTGRVNASSKNGNSSGLINLNSSSNAKYNPERRDSLDDSPLDNADTENQNISTIPEPSFMISLLSSRLIYVALAIIVNIMVTLKLEHLFGMSIVVPFFVIMIGRLCACKDDEVPQSNNMLVAALILSNVRPDLVKVIHRLKDCFSLSSKILQDFAVYMFTFVLMHTALRRYWNNLDYTSLFPDETQGIFDDNVSM